ncbi:hypothetical protein LTR94_037721, partial [Friedmanniomyces endolithicus]
GGGGPRRGRRPWSPRSYRQPTPSGMGDDHPGREARRAAHGIAGQHRAPDNDDGCQMVDRSSRGEACRIGKGL